MNRQVVLMATSADSSITAWDLNTGTLLTSYKGNASPRNGLCLLGNDYIVSAQTTKDSIQFWTWHKDHVLQRCFAMERMSAIAASQDGAYLAGGGVSGALYLWEVASGRLLRSWPSHYKGVSCLSFLESGTVLVSGGEDTRVCTWILSELLDTSLDTSSSEYLRPQPLYCWSEHTLPVTSVYCAVGESNALVVTASLDRTCKVHSLASGRLIRTFNFPVSIHCVTLDLGEHSLFAGGGDGTVFEVSLVGGSTAGGGSGAGLGSLAGGSGAAAMWKSVGGGGGGDPSEGSGFHRMEGHSRVVNCLSISLDGEHLVSGSDDGTVHVWDLRSRQSTSAIQSPGKNPVTSVLVIPQPVHLTQGSGNAAVGGGGRQGPKRPLPLAPLVKYPGMSGNLKPWEGPCVVVSGTTQSGCIAQALDLDLDSTRSAMEVDALAGGSSAQTAGQLGPLRAGGSTTQEGGKKKGGKDEVARLKAELEQAQANAQKWQALYKSSVDSLAVLQA